MLAVPDGHAWVAAREHAEEHIREQQSSWLDDLQLFRLPHGGSPAMQCFGIDPSDSVFVSEEDPVAALPTVLDRLAAAAAWPSGLGARAGRVAEHILHLSEESSLRFAGGAIDHPAAIARAWLARAGNAPGNTTPSSSPLRWAVKGAEEPGGSGAVGGHQTLPSEAFAARWSRGDDPDSESDL